MSDFDKDAYKSRLQSKLAAERKQRAKRFNRLALPFILFASAFGLFFTDHGRQIIGQIVWLGQDDAFVMRWFFAYVFAGVLITFGLEWLIAKAEKDRKEHD